LRIPDLDGDSVTSIVLEAVHVTEFLPADLDVYTQLAGEPQGTWNVLKLHSCEFHFCGQLIELNFIARCQWIVPQSDDLEIIPVDPQDSLRQHYEIDMEGNRTVRSVNFATLSSARLCILYRSTMEPIKTDS
jgi:hypothetical protein